MKNIELIVSDILLNIAVPIVKKKNIIKQYFIQ